ncbi:MAG: PP2C family protein-serine/threonine phosphatase, partial [Vicinamibacterales bacterium]
RIHPSPKRLLVEVNRILSHNLDGRSFISMTYAVMDLGSGRLEYARAGHTPLIHVTGQHEARVARVLAPDGIVVGLQHPGAELAFERHLDEASLTLEPGDLLVLYTDGLTEAMNEALDLFGESRLLSLAQQPSHDGVDALRERILAAVADFRGPAVQHDDMSMIVMEVQDVLSRRQSSAATESMQMNGLPA